MQIDRNALNQMLSLNDKQLSRIVQKLANEAGLDLSAFNIRDNDVQSLRRALEGATDQDISKAISQMENFKKK
jgi:hypothetical protein